MTVVKYVGYVCGLDERDEQRLRRMTRLDEVSFTSMRVSVWYYFTCDLPLSCVLPSKVMVKMNNCTSTALTWVFGGETENEAMGAEVCILVGSGRWELSWDEVEGMRTRHGLDWASV